MIYLVTFLLVIGNVFATTEPTDAPYTTSESKPHGGRKHVLLSLKEQAEITRALFDNPDEYYRLLRKLREQSTD